MFACVHVPGLCPEQEGALKACADGFAPQSEAGPEMVVFSVRGLRMLIGGPDDIARAIHSRATELGLAARIAVASNANAAIAAARGRDGITVIRPGEEGRILGDLPLDLLDPERHIAETLTLWGVRTFADLAALPENGVTARLGNEGLELWKLARGSADRPLLTADDKPTFGAGMEMEYPVELLEPLAFILSRLLNEVCTKLAYYGLAANQVDVSLRLENHPDFARSIRIPFATREAATFLRLLQYDLAAHPPPAPVVSVHLEAVPVKPRVVQTGLFIPLAPEAEKLELTLARIAAVVGDGNAGTPELLDTHRPGAFEMKRFDAGAPVMPAGSDVEPHLAIRLYRPPLKAQVIARNGHPARVAARGISGNVTVYAGPWRTSGDWWTPDPWARDEWDLELEDGALYRVYREGRGDWYIEGNYD